MVKNNMRIFGVTFILMLWSAVASAANVDVPECEGRCDDGAGNVMLVNAGRCNKTTEYCSAGCDESSEKGPFPYAACLLRASGQIAPRRPTVQTDARRERNR